MTKIAGVLLVTFYVFGYWAIIGAESNVEDSNEVGENFKNPLGSSIDNSQPSDVSVSEMSENDEDDDALMRKTKRKQRCGRRRGGCGRGKSCRKVCKSRCVKTTTHDDGDCQNALCSDASYCGKAGGNCWTMGGKLGGDTETLCKCNDMKSADFTSSCSGHPISSKYKDIEKYEFVRETCQNLTDPIRSGYNCGKVYICGPHLNDILCPPKCDSSFKTTDGAESPCQGGFCVWRQSDGKTTLNGMSELNPVPATGTLGKSPCLDANSRECVECCCGDDMSSQSSYYEVSTDKCLYPKP